MRRYRPVGTTPPQTVCGTTTSSPAVCAAAMSVTDCIARLIANDSTAIAYAGAGVADFQGSAVKAVAIDSIAFSETNIRELRTDPPNRYPLARFLYLNTNSVNLASQLLPRS